MKGIILAALLLLLAVVGIGMRAIARSAGVPSLDDPEQVTPPPARNTSQNDRHGTHS